MFKNALFQFGFISLLFMGAAPLVSGEQNQAQRKPLVKNGRYYYSETDKHNHMKSALSFLPKKAFKFMLRIPQNMVNGLISRFQGVKTEAKENVVALKFPLPEPCQSQPVASSIEPVVTWIGHASFLIQMGGCNILTDPLFGDVQAGPFHITNRVVAPGVQLEDLPSIDAILISHNHADHTDKTSLLAIYQKYPNVKMLVPEGNASLFQSMGIGAEAIIEKTWWDEYLLEKDGETVLLTFLPAKHWSIYVSPFGYRKSLWGSWMIGWNHKNIYFAGDTAYEDHFKQIAKRFEHIDLALLPIAPTNADPNHHNPCHVNAKEAIDAFIDLDARCFIPMHWGTIFKGPESLEYPINTLYEYWNSKKDILKDKKLVCAGWGQPYPLD